MRAEEATALSGGAIYAATDGFKVLLQPGKERGDGEPTIDITLQGVSQQEAMVITSLLDLPLEGWTTLTVERLATFFEVQPKQQQQWEQQQRGDIQRQ